MLRLVSNIAGFMTSYFRMTFMLLLSCNNWQNRPGVSESITDSKKRGVYICAYEASPNPIVVNDSLIFNVKMAWLERKWRYKKNLNQTDPMEKYQLVIITQEVIHKGFDQTWTIGVSFDRHIRTCGKNCLMTDFEKLPISNKEVWAIQNGKRLNPEAEKIILGDFTLYKKLTQ